MTGWQPDGTDIQPNGDFGGDIQRGGSYSVRFRRPGLPGAVVTCTSYAVEDAGANPGQFWVQTAIEWLICTDPDHPGDTATWSDIEYEDEGRSWVTPAEAEAQAQQVAGEWLDAAPTIDWDGQPQ